MTSSDIITLLLTLKLKAQYHFLMRHKYYYAHETAYQAIQERGEFGWQKSSVEQFRDVEFENALRAMVSKYFASTMGKTALDLGCGSGPAAHILDDCGFTASGIDISPSAIELARSIAQTSGKSIHFEIADVLSLQDAPATFDLVCDSFCLHCIVFDDDRIQALRSIHNSLKPEGVFAVHTMIFRETATICARPEPLRFDSDYILWHRTSQSNLEGTRAENEQLWCPQRRILPVDKVLLELRSSGFGIMDYTLVDQGADQVSMLHAVCRRL